MSERARVARLAICFLFATLFAGASPAVVAEDGAARPEPPEAPVTEHAQPSAEPAPPAESPPAEPLPQPPPAPPPGPPPLGPGLAGEADVPSVPPAAETAGGEEPAPPAPPKHLRTIRTDEAAGILGKRVTGAAGEDVGMVVDVLVDTAGKPRAAVVDFGGFLGVGTRKIAVDWTFLQFRPGDRNAPVLLDVTADAIRAAPEFRPSDAEASVVVAPPAADPEGASAAPADEAPAEPAAGQPAPGAATPAPSGGEDRAEPPAAADTPERPPLPEMKPPDGRPKLHPPAAGVPSTDDLGPGPAPALPQIPPDARQ